MLVAAWLAPACRLHPPEFLCEHFCSVRTSNFPDEHHGAPRIRNVVVTGVEGDLLTILRKVHARCETRVNRSAPSCAVFERRQVHPLRRKVGVVDKEETLARELAALGARVE